jgi:hypothetical protein
LAQSCFHNISSDSSTSNYTKTQENKMWVISVFKVLGLSPRIRQKSLVTDQATGDKECKWKQLRHVRTDLRECRQEYFLWPPWLEEERKKLPHTLHWIEGGMGFELSGW